MKRLTVLVCIFIVVLLIFINEYYSHINSRVSQSDIVDPSSEKQEEMNTSKDFQENKFDEDKLISKESYKESDSVNEKANLIFAVDKRLQWIYEHNDDFTSLHNEDPENNISTNTYNENQLIRRTFSYSFDETDEEEFAVYSLFYDAKGSLIYADIAHYRSWLYNMYFYNDKLLHVDMEMGPLSVEDFSEYIDLAQAESIVFENLDMGLY